jgi:hypothetical protein
VHLSRVRIAGQTVSEGQLGRAWIAVQIVTEIQFKKVLIAGESVS